MAFIVFLLCAVTSLACAVLLMRGYIRSRQRLLLWSSLCFTGLFLNNVLLLLDSRLSADLASLRTLPALAGVIMLLYGLIWDSRR